jgi:hypothetical protein
MSLKTLMIAKAVICVVFGLGFVILPVTVAGWYGMSFEPAGEFFARLFGQAFILIALLLFFARDTKEPVAQKAVAAAVCIGDALGLVVSLIAVLGGVTNALGWLTVVLYGVLAVAFGVFLFRRPPLTTD